MSESLDTKAVTQHPSAPEGYSNNFASLPKAFVEPDDWAVVALGKQRKGWVLGFKLDRAYQPTVECAKCGHTYRVGARASALGSLGAHQQGAACKNSPMGRWYLARDERERGALKAAFGRFWVSRFRAWSPERREAELDRARAFVGLSPRVVVMTRGEREQTTRAGMTMSFSAFREFSSFTPFSEFASR